MGSMSNWNALGMVFSGSWGGFTIEDWKKRLFCFSKADSSQRSGRGHGGGLGSVFYRNALIMIFSGHWGCFFAK